MFETIFPYIMAVFAIIGVGAFLVGLNKFAKWLSGIIYFYHKHGQPKKLQAIVDGDDDSFFTICHFDGFIEPESLSVITERFEWVQQNIKGQVYISTISRRLAISFLDPQDAVAFKLRWA